MNVGQLVFVFLFFIGTQKRILMYTLRSMDLMYLKCILVSLNNLSRNETDIILLFWVDKIIMGNGVRSAYNSFTEKH